MQLYLNRHKYSNTLSSDLWKALEEVSSVRVESVMNSWVKQVGFPVIQVRVYLAQLKIYVDIF